MGSGKSAGDSARLERLLAYLSDDPDNLSLLSDAANEAFNISKIVEAKQLLGRYAKITPLPAGLVNLLGLVAIREGNWGEAASIFDRLRAEGSGNPAVRFNRAWIHAIQNEHQHALALLDDEAVAVTPRAASLKVQMLHHLGQLDAALAEGAKLVARFPGNDDLLGALSVAAMDADDPELASHYALQAGGGADALTTQGLLTLNQEAPSDALALFDRALEAQPLAPRAWLGKGLGLLAAGNAGKAAQCLEKGAELFGDHLGSWISAGWAKFVAGDLGGARSLFEHALALDGNFAESHGALAVADIAAGHLDSARRRADIALRLDKDCFGGLLARTLLLEADGNPALAGKIRERAMNMPVGVGGKTLAQAMMGLGLSPSGGKTGT